MKIHLLTGAMAVALATVSAGAASAAVITFSEPSLLDVVTDQYAGLGVTFSGSNFGVLAGNSNGDPGGWDLEGTNTPHFLGYNDPYGETLTFSTPIVSFLADFSRSAGSSDGTITIQGFSGLTLISTDVIVLGDINSWTTGSVAGAALDRVTWTGTGTGFHPFGVDNVQFTTAAGGAIPEPATWAMMVMGFGALGGVLRRRPGIAIPSAA